MKNFKSSESRDGGRDRREGGSFGKRDNFRGNGFSKPSFGGKSFGRDNDFKKKSYGNDRGEVTMSKATCSECSNVCEVPFKPNGERPVFCSNCFMSKRDGTFEKKDERKGNLRENDRKERRDSYFTPVSNTPNTSNSSAEVADLKKQITNLNTKIDSLANVVDKFMVSQASVVTTKKVEVAPKTEIKSTQAAKKEVVKKVTAKKEVTKKVVAVKKEVVKAVVKKVAKAVIEKAVTKKVVAKKEVAKKVQASKVATGLAKKK